MSRNQLSQSTPRRGAPTRASFVMAGRIWVILTLLTALVGLQAAPVQAATFAMNGNQSGTASPAACTTVNLEAAADTYLSAGNVTYNNGGNTVIHVDATTGTSRRTALLKWNLSSIPSSATVSSASITVNVTDVSPLVFNLYNMRRTWVEGTSSQAASTDSANWNTSDGATSWGTEGAANTSSDRYDTNLWGASASSFSSTGSKTETLNAAGLAVVQGWIAGTTSNYGLTMQNYSGSTSNAVYFSSSEATTAANRPILNVTYCASTGPTITTTGTLSAFTSQPGVASAEQSYTVSGSELTNNIVITAPSDFQISTISGSGFGSSVTLTQIGGSVVSTPIYVHYLRATEGSSSGNITHTSTGATAVNVAVSGTASNCTTVNLVAAEDTYLSANDVTFNNGGNTELHVDATTGTSRRAALLKWDVSASGSGIPSNATVSSASITVNVTDASPLVFNLYNMRRTWVEGTGSRTASTTSANWNTYDGATSWGTEGAANTSSDRYDTNLWGAGTSSFSSTGSKTEILNNDGVAVVQGWIAGTTSNYGLTMQNFSGSTSNAVFFSSSEATTAANRPILNVTYCATVGPTITTTGLLSAFTSTPGVPSAQQSYTVSGSNLAANITITPPANFELSVVSGSGFGTAPIVLTQSGGSVASKPIYVRFNRATVGASSGNITHVSSGATQKDVAVSGTASNGAPTVTLVQPADNATGVSYPPTLQAMVTDPEAETSSVSFYGRPVGTGTGQDFMLALVPDAQNESQYAPTMFTAQTNWIVSNKSTNNIVFVTTAGDMVNTANSTTEYVNADAAIDILDAGGVWYSVAPGNHDSPGYSSPLRYPDYFGTSRYASHLYANGGWFGGSYDNYNTYSLFSTSGMDFILINLQYQPTTAILNWADALLTTYSNRRAIVEEHDILNVDNSFVNQASYDALRDHDNLFLMLCGHMHSGSDGAAYVAGTGTGGAGQTIHIVLADYQDMSNGNGWLRLFRFSPANNTIYMTTYSPYTSGSITTDPDQKNLAYAMTSSGPYTLIGTVNGVASGSTASIDWTGLSPSTEYEWYAVANDGATSTPSATWSFTTGTSTAALPKPPVMNTIAATGATKADVTLTWDAVTQDVNNNPTTIDNYRVFRSQDPYFTTGGTQRSTDPLTATSFTDAGAAASMTNWYYLVRAHNGAGWGQGSSLARKVGKFTFGLTPGQ